MALIPPKLCAYCREPFTPTRPEQACCRALCARRKLGERLRGKVPTKAVEAKKAHALRIRQAQLRSRFGELSQREQAIYEAGLRKAWMDGYNAALAQRRKRAASQDVPAKGRAA